MTWNDLAEIINQMTPQQRREEIIMYGDVAVYDKELEPVYGEDGEQLSYTVSIIPEPFNPLDMTDEGIEVYIS